MCRPVGPCPGCDQNGIAGTQCKHCEDQELVPDAVEQEEEAEKSPVLIRDFDTEMQSQVVRDKFERNMHETQSLRDAVRYTYDIIDRVDDTWVERMLVQLESVGVTHLEHLLVKSLEVFDGTTLTKNELTSLLEIGTDLYSTCVWNLVAEVVEERQQEAEDCDVALVARDRCETRSRCC